MNKDIDREIAIEIMNWKIRKNNTDTFQEFWYYIPTNEPSGGVFCEYVKDWRPTENIAQAFEVVEKMHQKGFYLKLRGPFINPDDWEWYCYFELHTTTDTHPLWVGRAETPTMAICLAALKATDGDGESGGDEE